MRIDITFHGPFRVATGKAAPGVDTSVDPAELLPAESLKGVMRAAATRIGVRRELVDAVFGTTRQAAPWAWLTPIFVAPPVIDRQARVALDADSGTVEQRALVVAHQVWATAASFDIERIATLEQEEADRHALVLAMAARGVRSLGHDRNRGLGWVSMAAAHPPPRSSDPAYVRQAVL